MRQTHTIAILLLTLLYIVPAKAEKIIKDTLEAGVITTDARTESVSSNKAVPVTRIFIKRLEAEKVVTYKDLSAIVPNLYVPDYGSKMTSSIYIRGLGARIDNPVMGMYVDGIGYANKNSFDTELFDIRSAEIFRGPQGTMFGRNTIGGVISINTISPMDYQGTRAYVSYGNANTLKASLSDYRKINGNLAFGTGIYYTHTDGFFRNTYPDAIPGGSWTDPALCDWADEAGGRFRTVWKASDNLVIDNTLSINHVNQGGFPYSPVGGEISYNDICAYNRTGITEGLNIRLETDRYKISSSTSYQYTGDRMRMDQDYMPKSWFTLTQSQQEHYVSHEVSIRPVQTGKWERISGASVFYKHNSMGAPVTFKREGIEELILKGANGGIASAFPGEEIKILQDSFVIGSDFRTSTAGIAAYHTSFYRTGNWKFEAGLRLDCEYGRFNYNSAATIDYLFTMTMDEYKELNSRLSGTEHQVFFQVLPRISATWSSGKTSAFASVSKGYKAGGFNTQLFSDILQNKMMSDMMGDLGVSFEGGMGGSYEVADVIKYKPEKCWNFEVGANSSVTLGSAVLSGAATVFLIETIDQQLTVFPKTGTGRMMTNAGRSRSIGAEVSASLSVSGLNIDASYGFTDARFVRYDNGKEDFSGNYIPYIPSNTLSLSATYALRVQHRHLYGIDFNINTRGFGRIIWNEENTLSQPFYALLGASARFLFDGFSVEFWGKNITGTKYDTFYFVSMGNEFLQRGKPVQYGISLKLEI